MTKSLELHRYNEITMKASHNSYERKESLTKQMSWDIREPHNCGCLGLELDIRQWHNVNEWVVRHDPYSGVASLAPVPTDPTLRLYLNELRSYVRSQMYSYRYLFVAKTLYLDVKSVHNRQDFHANLDSYLKEHFDVDLYTPADHAANGGVWPTMRELEGKFIICLTGDEQAKQAYDDRGGPDRLCFTDQKADGPSDVVVSDRAFYNYHIYHDKRNEWMETFRTIRKQQPNKIIRAYIANRKENWDNSVASGCNIIATDKVSNHDWATLGTTIYKAIE